MAFHSPQLDPGSASLLPFGGLGLDLALVRRKVTGLRLLACRTQEARRPQPLPAPPPRLSGYSLMLRLRRETRGS